MLFVFNNGLPVTPEGRQTFKSDVDAAAKAVLVKIPGAGTAPVPAEGTGRWRYGYRWTRYDADGLQQRWNDHHQRIARLDWFDDRHQ